MPDGPEELDRRDPAARAPWDAAPPARIAHLSAADEADYLAMTRASRDYHRPWTHPAVDRAGFAALLARAARADVEALVVRAAGDDAIVGVFVLSQIADRDVRSAFLGYYGSALHARRGYMTAGMSLTLEHAFETVGIERVEANIQPRNARSLALARRCGFRREGLTPRYLKIAGQWRDHERWTLRADEWREVRRRSLAGAGGAAPSA
ncbi:MAG TPA: GNAT family protein [Solirubrobacteraceae bacterium]|nr:GNAT family protein [Solirubrobacteraceae bacterium]